MHSLRKWFYKPKREDTSKLAVFYWADEELTMVTTELDSFDGRTDPERCSLLVAQLRFCQDKVLSICNDIMDEAIPDLRANRDFRAKFPDDVLHENLAGQLWFGAECLAAGSDIIHREVESAGMRPLAKALTRALNNVRCLLCEQSLKNVQEYSLKVKDALRIFDRLFAEFELCYVSTMVPIKSAKEYHLQQEIVVLFSETLIRGLELGLVNQEMVDDYDPSLMFTIPRLAIVWGLLVFSDGPFNVERDAENMSELFSPFRNLLQKIRDLLWTLTRGELTLLEKMLCSQEEPKIEEKVDNQAIVFPSMEDFVNSKYSQSHLNSKQFVQDFYFYNFGMTVDEAGNQLIANDENVKVGSHRKGGLTSINARLRQSLRHTSSDHFESDISGLVSNTSFGSLNFGGSLTSLGGNAQRMNDSKPSGDGVEAKSTENVRTHNFSRCSPQQKYDLKCLCSSSQDFTSLTDNYGVEGTHSLPYRYRVSSTQSPERRRKTRRALMQHVMNRMDIVPSERQVSGYSSSSPGESPRPYRRLTHSFPVQYDTASLRDCPGELRVPTATFRCRYGSPLRLNCGIAPSRAHNCDNCSSPVGSCNTNMDQGNSSPLSIPRIRDLDERSCDATYSSCSSCQSISSASSTDFNSTSPETSSYNSDCRDDEEIALALQAAEIASRNKPRSRFKSSGDLLHKLFVCISGVADQLQTNFASDLRNILKSVFDMNCTQVVATESDTPAAALQLNESVDENTRCTTCVEQSQNLDTSLRETRPTNVQIDFPVELLSDPVLNFHQLYDDERDRSSVDSAEEALPDSPTSLIIAAENENPASGFHLGPPAWLPDEFSSHCMGCELPFTILRRRHHCRNCGKIFCSRCSSNLIPLPQFGHLKPVRVCNQCFVYQLTNLVMQSTNA